MFSRTNYLNRRFFDEKHFPYGFSRSGDFTFNEVKELEAKGALFKALSDGIISDPTKEDKHFLDVLSGKVNAATLAEKAWLKYLQRCNRAPVWLTTRRMADDEDLEADDDEIAIDDEEAELDEAV